MEKITYPEGSAHFPESPIPVNRDCVTAVHTQECYKSAEESSDSDSDPFCTPPTSLIPTDDVSCNYWLLHLYS